MDKFIKYTFIVVFAILLSTIGILTLLRIGVVDKKEFVTIEKRNPAEKPLWKWGKGEIKDYFPKLESFINDNFALRSTLVRLKSMIGIKVGLIGASEKVIVGKNGFLFLGNPFDQVIDQVTGKKKFTKKQLSEWQNFFQKKKEYLDKQNIPMYIAIAPNKHSIYPEYLPESIKPSSNNQFQQIIDSNFGFNIINLKDALLREKKSWGNLLYHKTDTHWNVIGSYLGYREMIKQFLPKFRDLNILDINPSDFSSVPSKQGGDLAYILNVAGTVDDPVISFKTSDKWSKKLIKLNFAGDTLPVDYLQYIGAFEQCVIINPDKPYTLLLLKDSFSSWMVPYLNQTFGKVVYCHYAQNEAIELTQLIEKYKPDVVMYEIVERNIDLRAKVPSESMGKVPGGNLTSICKMNGNSLKERIELYNQITSCKLEDDKLVFTSTGINPYFIIPKTKLPRNNIVISIDYYTASETICQLFYLTATNQHYDDNQSFKQVIQKGRNIVKFLIPEKDIDGNSLRFDPGANTGDYTINSIEIFKSEDPQL
jgi:alginate O-acetyltransferase complex protein AlgJ